jgi:hypothetical protein
MDWKEHRELREHCEENEYTGYDISQKQKKMVKDKGVYLNKHWLNISQTVSEYLLSKAHKEHSPEQIKCWASKHKHVHKFKKIEVIPNIISNNSRFEIMNQR